MISFIGGSIRFAGGLCITGGAGLIGYKAGDLLSQNIENSREVALYREAGSTAMKVALVAAVVIVSTIAGGFLGETLAMLTSFINVLQPQAILVAGSVASIGSFFGKTVGFVAGITFADRVNTCAGRSYTHEGWDVTGNDDF